MDKEFALRVGNVWTYIVGPMSEDLRKEIQAKVSYVMPGFKYTPTYKNMVAKSERDGTPIEWDGTKTTARRTQFGLCVPSGLLSYIKEILEEKGIKCDYEEYRTPVVRTTGWGTEGLDLFDYQDETNETIKRRQRGVLEMSTGGGKTELIAKNIVDVACFPAVFYVPNTDLLQQTYKRFMKYIRYNGQPIEIGRVGAGYCDVRPITISTVQSAQIAIEGKFTKYAFDDVEMKEKVKLTLEEKGRIADMVRSAQYVYVDECFQHRTQVTLGDGKTKTSIGTLVNNKYTGKVMSWNEKTQKFEPKQVTGWIRKTPSHPLVHIGLGRCGGLICTDNHLFYTSRGEIPAGKLVRGDMVRASLQDSKSVAALSPEGLQVVLGTSLGDGSLGIPANRSINARLVITHSLKQKEYLNYKLSFLSNLYSGMRPAKSGYSGEEELQGYTVCSPEFTSIMKMSKAERIKTLDWLGLVILFLDDGSYNQRCKGGTISCYTFDDIARKELVDKLKSLGMPASTMTTCKGKIIYIEKRGMDIFAPYIARFAPSCLRYKVPFEFRHLPQIHVKHSIPNYGWITVRSIGAGKLSKHRQMESDVYCLNVEDNHTFLANGCVVHNCQHVAADTIQAVLNNSHGARFRIGGSASPWRDDGLDLLIEACFGRRLCKIPASFLIRRDPPRLVRPRIVFNHFRWFLGHVANFQELYTKFIVENDARNEWIAQRALFHMEQNRPTIILVKWARHAEFLKALIPGSEVLTSTGEEAKTSKQRDKVLDLMRERKLMCIIGTTLLDEGVDVPSAGAGIFAGGGKSSTRALQRVGRIIRVDKEDPDKKMAHIEEFYDHCRWLTGHALARRRIYETEPEFQILDNADTIK